jgi:hypothetical protein
MVPLPTRTSFSQLDDFFCVKKTSETAIDKKIGKSLLSSIGTGRYFFCRKITGTVLLIKENSQTSLENKVPCWDWDHSDFMQGTCW